MAKRLFLFFTVNILIMVTLSVVLSVLGVRPYLDAQGINYSSLMVFCLIWGFGSALISLALSKVMAKWMMGVKIIDPATRDPRFQELVQKVYQFAKRSGIEKMPEVGYYESPELNAFATGPTKNRSLVAVSTGLMDSMNSDELEGVLAHEVAHIANVDMVTMTLIQGVVNAFVMFLARIAGFFISQAVEEERRPLVQMLVVIVLEICLSILGSMVVASFSRKREFRADAGGAKLAGSAKMVAALERLKMNYGFEPEKEESQAMASLKISGRPGKFLRLLSTHPALEDRIARLKSVG